MEYRHQKLQQDLAALSTAFTQLGSYLAGVAKEITSPGVVPSTQLVEQLTTSRNQFDALRAGVHQLAADMLVSPMPKIDEVGTVTSIESLLKSAIVAEENKNSVDGRRAAALAIVGRVLSIRHRDANDFKPLLDCHAIATVTRDAVAAVTWPHQHSDSALLIAEKHPFNSLLTLVEHRDDLDDERWIVLEETVTKHYGKPLTVAASRGKLFQSAGSPAPATPAAAPSAAKPAGAPEAPKPASAPAAAPEAAKPEPAKPAPAQPAPAPAAEAPKPAEAAKPAATPAPTVEAQSPAPAAAPISEAPKSAAPAAKPAPEAPKPAPAPVAEAPKPAPVPAPVPEAAKPVAPVADAKPVVAAKPAPEAPKSEPAKVEPAKVEKKEVSTKVEQAAVVVAPPPVAPPVPARHPVEATASVAAPAPEARISAPPAEAPSDKKREPRLAPLAPAAAPHQAVQVEVKIEEKASEPALDKVSVGADLGQRPQRWGFWRGNR